MVTVHSLYNFIEKVVYIIFQIEFDMIDLLIILFIVCIYNLNL